MRQARRQVAAISKSEFAALRFYSRPAAAVKFTLEALAMIFRCGACACLQCSPPCSNLRGSGNLGPSSRCCTSHCLTADDSQAQHRAVILGTGAESGQGRGLKGADPQIPGCISASGGHQLPPGVSAVHGNIKCSFENASPPPPQVAMIRDGQTCVCLRFLAGAYFEPA